MSDVLTGWIQQRQQQLLIPLPRQPLTGLLFAFYGRVSTVDYQDPASSRQWQWDNACELVAGRGRIVKRFFDVGFSRTLAWPRRPQADALLKALADPNRGFDAVVVGEYERAFYGNQFIHIVKLFRQYGVQLWMPEVDGPVDFDDPEHMALMRRLGMRAKLEVWRTRTRVLAAMQAQTRDQGRFLGGRPPYGYRLVDAGPHPNHVHAGWGRRLRCLAPDPATAPHVRWMFAERLAGHSVAAIVRGLNARGVPCPSDVDPDRNSHRTGGAWCLRSVAVILANPRYTGFQVWNRQYTEHNPNDPKNLRRRGSKNVIRRNPPEQWAISHKAAHPALISERDFVAAQEIRVAPHPVDGPARHYELGGLIRCGICQRRFDSHWVNNRAGYRCRHGHNSSKPSQAGRAKVVYLREDHALAQLNALTESQRLSSVDKVKSLARSGELLLWCSAAGTLCLDWTSTPAMRAGNGYRSMDIVAG